MNDNRKNFNRHARRTAKNLRKIADNIEHELERECNKSNPIGDIAEEIMNIVTWGFANLQMGLLLRWTIRAIDTSKQDALIAALMLNCDRIDEHGFNCQTGNEHCTLELCPLVEEES